MSIPNTVDYVNTGDYPSDPDTLNYNYSTATYNEPRPIESDYQKTNYDITNFPKTDYNKFNASLSNYNEIKSLDSPNILLSDNIDCKSPDMLYQVPRDPQYNYPEKYMCFNTQSKLIEITRNEDRWYTDDLTNSEKHITWQGSQCKINTDKCNNMNITENCEATCYTSPNDAFVIKYQNNIWRRPELEENAGPCSMTAISEETAQNSFCKCDTTLDRPYLQTKSNFDTDRTGKFWCSKKQ